MNARGFLLSFSLIASQLAGLCLAEGGTLPGATSGGIRCVAVLADGKELEGTIAKQTFAMQTAYGRFAFNTRELGRVDFARDYAGLDSVLSLTSDRLSGFLIERSFPFQPSSKSLEAIPSERLTSIIFPPQSIVSTRPGNWWFRLRNGDLLSGTMVGESTPFATADWQEGLQSEEVAAFLLTTNRPGYVTALRQDGSVREAVLRTNILTVKLELGPEISLRVGGIRSVSQNAGFIQPSLADAQASTANRTNALPPVHIEGFVWVPPGEFVMGSPANENGRDLDEGPLTRVILVEGFWMCAYEVTQSEYERTMGVNPSINTGDLSQPVEKVSWFEAMEYCARRTETEQSAGQLPEGFAYRLPTEAEWEYACRAGSTTRFFYGDDDYDARLGDYCWFTRNSGSMPHPVGRKRPNGWGLYDMHGNVWEWCLDRWSNGLPGGTVTNQPTVVQGTLRTARGGSWLYEARACRSANRDDYGPSNRCGDVGLRVVLARALQ